MKNIFLRALLFETLRERAFAVHSFTHQSLFARLLVIAIVYLLPSASFLPPAICVPKQKPTQRWAKAPLAIADKLSQHNS